MNSRLVRWTFGMVLAIASLSGMAHAQTELLNEVRTLSSGTTPVEQEIDIPAAGNYRVNLVDFGFPAPLAVAKLAVTQGATVVATGATSPAAASVAVDFAAATSGKHVIRIVGVPGTSGQGSVGVTVSQVNGATVTQLNDFVFTLAAPATPRPNLTQLEENFTLQTAGSYEVQLTDFALPSALPDLALSIVEVGPNNQVAVLTSAGSATFNAQAGVQYRLAALGQADDAVGAGLFSVRIHKSGSTTNDFARTLPVGRVEQTGSVVLDAPGSYELVLNDLQFPSPLTSVGAAITQAGEVAVSVAAPGSTAFTAAAGQYLIYSLATTTGASIGSYGVEVRNASNAVLFSTVKTKGGGTGPVPAYQFVTDISAAGTYRVRLADFAFPGALTDVQLGISQEGQLLGTLSGAGSVDVANVKAGSSLYLLALASPAVEAGGVFGIDVTAAGGSTPVFEATQGVDNLFQSRQVSATGSTAFRVTLTDLGFPHTFKDLGAIVTRGATVVGKVLNSASFDFNATPGNYFINFIATPDPTELTKAGTYGIRVADKPPAPVVTLTASTTQVTTGGEVTLSWNATNATSCTASNGWSGSRAVKGDELIRGVNTAATYKLECMGEGGTASATAAVSVVAETSTGGGGGGAMGWLSLIGLAFAGLARSAGRRRLAGSVTA
jgi:hypothetical protein